MLRFLFQRLTPARGSALFEALVGEARQPHWYVAGQVPDTIDGRFAMLSTLIALASIRLDHGGEESQEASAALTERFVEAMDTEHRELGISDPAIGKKVRKLVGSLAGRIDLWRGALDDCDRWDETAAKSLFRDSPPAAQAVEHCGQHLRLLWTRLAALPDEAVAEGRLT